MGLLDRMGPEKLVAVAAALVTGGAVYLMPQAVLQEAVIASGLPSVLPPLEPPLGARARIGLSLFAAGTVFGLVVLVLGLLARRSDHQARKAAAQPAAEDDHLPVPPRVRRRDRHPDAPVRAPLQIDREIGLPEERPQRPERPQPESAPEPSRRIRAGRVEEELPPEPPVFELGPDAIVDAPEPEPEPEPQAPVIEKRQEPPRRREQVPSHPAWLEVPEPRPVPSTEPLAELVERLERAMAKRAAGSTPRTPAPEPAPPAAIPAPEAAEEEEDGPDARLRNALESLKRFAPQRG
jgi:hypothetical protein